MKSVIAAFAVALCFVFQFTISAFLHPGILQTSQDLARMRSKATSSKEPWKTAFAHFAADQHSSLSYRLKGPLQVVTRDKDAKKTKGMGEFAADSVAALQLSQMWVITQDVKYAAKVLEILNAWGKVLRRVTGMTTLLIQNRDTECPPTDFVQGSDGQLAAALSGSNFVNAAEIIRATYSFPSIRTGWKTEDIAKFSNMVSQVLVPPAAQQKDSPGVSKPFQANWGSAAEKFMLAAAVFTDNRKLFDEAKRLIRSSACANFSRSISPSGQSSESG
jgi:hypothetical protein